MKRRKQRGKSKEARDERRQSEVRTGEGDEEVRLLHSAQRLLIVEGTQNCEFKVDWYPTIETRCV